MTPPPPAGSLAAMIRPTPQLGESQTNQDVMRVFMERPGLGWLLLVGLCLGGLVAGAVTWIYQIYQGLGIAGYSHPIFWGAYIVTFVFWVGIAHAGTLISAILFLFRAKWRNAINRSAEAMTIFAVFTAQLFLGIHVGRIWKAYFILPYPNQRALWVNFKSPLLWDTFAISTYTLISLIFFYVGLLPDLAIARDREHRAHESGPDSDVVHDSLFDLKLVPLDGRIENLLKDSFGRQSLAGSRTDIEIS